jgi:ATP-grasp domain, R2K clade family 3
MTTSQLLIVPADPLNLRRPDEHFAGEAEAARTLGMTVAVVDLDALEGGDTREAIRRIPDADEAIYRGWMLTSDTYRALAEALAVRGTTLQTSPDQYKRAHELPGWYIPLAEHTPESVWTSSPSIDEFVETASSFGSGPVVLRDYVKSMKHYWHEAAFIPDVSDRTAAVGIARRFVELRGDSFTGGFVLRRFERFVPPEVRTWWIRGHLALVTAHPDTPDQLPPVTADFSTFSDSVRAIQLPFVTVDVTKDEAGAWRIVELGDGQVSDRPPSTPPETLIKCLNDAQG